MKQLTLALALTATFAFADDRLNQVASHARDLAADYTKMTVTLKDKNFATQELQEELKDADSQLNQIRALLNDYGDSKPNLTEAQQKDWKRAQDLVALLNVFQGRKTELLSGDNPHKKRNSIRTEAQALATRAKLLEQTVLRLL